MLKAICKNLVWMTLPLGLALGCAEHRPPAEAVYGPTPILTPTSGEPEQRIYSTDPASVTAAASVDAAPPGASAADWELAETIRQKLTQDPTLAPLGSKLIAEVGKDGVVTLKGAVKTPGEKQRVDESISKLPGVKGVNDDQLKIGTLRGDGQLDMR